MRIGLYFGSFNPIHIGHLIVANHVLNETGIHQLWFVVSPLNPFKPADTLLNEYDRLHLVERSIADDPRLRVTDVEFTLPKPSYTFNTLSYLSQKHPHHQFHLVMGSDGFQNMERWKNGRMIMEQYPIIVYKRPGFELVSYHGVTPIVLSGPLLQISATYIRELLYKQLSVKYLIPSAIEEEIKTLRFYKKGYKK